MSYDIGPKIGIEGEEAFRRQLREISANLKTMGSEMKVVTATFKGNEDSMEALTARNEVLGKTIEELNKKLKAQEKFISENGKELSESAEASAKWERALNESRAEIITLERELKQNNERLEEMRREAANAGDAVEDLGNETKRAADKMDDAGGAALSFGEALKASFVGNLAADGAKALINGLVQLGGQMISLDEQTKEYRAQQGLLQSSFKTNKLDANDARRAYEGLFKVIGDSGKATEAAQLLGNLATSSSDIDFWVQAAAGSWGKFSEAIPVENLIEASNEAANTGESVSALDDAISWSGGNVEQFKEKLAECATKEERLSLITATLAENLGDSANAFYENNEQLIAERENILLLDRVTGLLGESVAKAKTQLVEEFGPALAESAEALAAMVEGVEGADEKFGKAIDSWLEVAHQKGPEFVEEGLNFLFSLLEGLLSDPEKISDTTFKIINSIIDGLVDHSPELAERGTELALALLAGFIENHINWYDKTGEFLDNIREAFINREEELGSIGKRLVRAILGNYEEALEGAKQKWENFLSLFSIYSNSINIGANFVKPSQQATGMYSVPYDGFLASLHEGEMVLTRKQAEFVRANGVNNTGVQTMTESVINTMAALSGSSVSDATITIILQLPDGDEFARAQLPSLIRVAEAAGTPITMQ